MPRFVHIDIAADDPEREASFFRDVFGWTVTKLDGPVPYWLLNPSPNDPTAVGAGIAKREQAWQTVNPTIDVLSVDDVTAKIETAGGTIVVPRTTLPGVGVLVTFKDPSGNIFSILEPVIANALAPDSRALSVP
jgi:predicted enzyme related to lactoylglutathione lyase